MNGSCNTVCNCCLAGIMFISFAVFFDLHQFLLELSSFPPVKVGVKVCFLNFDIFAKSKFVIIFLFNIRRLFYAFYAIFISIYLEKS